MGQLRRYLGDTPDAYAGGSIPSRDAYDLRQTSETSFVAFEMQVGNSLDEGSSPITPANVGPQRRNRRVSDPNRWTKRL